MQLYIIVIAIVAQGLLAAAVWTSSSMLNVSLVFVLVEALHPSQQFFSHVGMEPPLPG